MKSVIIFLSSIWIILLSPSNASAEISVLPRIETVVLGEYPEVLFGSGKMVGLDLEIHFGYFGYNNSQSFYTTVKSDRKLSVPDLSSLSEDELENLLPIHMTFSVPSPSFGGVEQGAFYLSSFQFSSVQEYKDFFGSPLSIFFRYRNDRPIVVKVSTSDGSAFSSWYSSNIGAKSCLFIAVKLLSPQGSEVAAEFVSRIGSNGLSERGAFFVFKADKDLNYKVVLFSSSNPYVCNGGSGAYPNESLSRVILETVYSGKDMSFPSEILISVP